MSLAKRSRHAGISLIEILMVIGILLVLIVLSIRTFSTANSRKALETEAQHVVAELNRARSLTLSSKNSQAYGVRFATSTLTFFQGPTFEVGSSTNESVRLHQLVQIASTSFAGGGSDVLFTRLSGETAHYGTITLSLTSSSTIQKTVTIYKTGLVEIQ